MTSPLLERIEPLIRRILQSPSTIPTQVTAKTVRQQLIDEYGVSKSELSNEKQQVKDLILAVFKELFPGEGGGAEDETMKVASPLRAKAGETSAAFEPLTPLKRKRDELVASETIAPSSPAVPLVEETKKKPKKKDIDSDEEMARKLQKTLNSTERVTRHGGTKKRKGTAESAKGKKSRVKSATYVKSDGESGSGSEDSENEEKPRKRRSKAQDKDGEGSGRGGGKGGFSRPYILSEPLAAVLGQTTLSRPQVVKQLWDYIKNNNLQKESNKRVIICDERLQKVFEKPEIDMFQMNKVLGSHLRTEEE